MVKIKRGRNSSSPKPVMQSQNRSPFSGCYYDCEEEGIEKRDKRFAMVRIEFLAKIDRTAGDVSAFTEIFSKLNV
jgi:hypothetical protein